MQINRGERKTFFVALATRVSSYYYYYYSSNRFCASDFSEMARPIYTKLSDLKDIQLILIGFFAF